MLDAEHNRVARLARFSAACITIVLLLTTVAQVIYVTGPVREGRFGGLGIDFDLYMGFTRSWLEGEGFYLPVQLTGEAYLMEDALGNTYPPTELYLLLPFALGAPHLLWWAIPLAIVVGSLWIARPAWWAWPILGLVLIYPRTWIVLLLGNPSMWAIAAIVAGVVWSWPAVGAWLKLPLAPLALIGAHNRSWWIAVCLTVLLALPFGSMWSEYLSAITNARSSRGAAYVLGEWPIALGLVVVAISGRADRLRSIGGRLRHHRTVGA